MALNQADKFILGFMVAMVIFMIFYGLGKLIAENRRRKLEQDEEEDLITIYRFVNDEHFNK